MTWMAQVPPLPSDVDIGCLHRHLPDMLPAPSAEMYPSLIVRNTFVDIESANTRCLTLRRSTTWPTDTRSRHKPLRLGGNVSVTRRVRHDMMQFDMPEARQAQCKRTLAEQAHHNHNGAEISYNRRWHAVPHHILESFPHRIPLQTLEVPSTFTFHYALAMALGLAPSFVLAATEQRAPGPVDSLTLRTCVRNLRHVIPRGLLLFCMPNVGVLHVLPNGCIRTLTRDELGLQILCNYFGYTSLALYGTSLSHHARPVCVWLPLQKRWSAPWLVGMAFSRKELFHFSQPQQDALRWHTLCISDRMDVCPGPLNANNLLKTRRW